MVSSIEQYIKKQIAKKQKQIKKTKGPKLKLLFEEVTELQKKLKRIKQNILATL